jgi:hypothetical protein
VLLDLPVVLVETGWRDDVTGMNAATSAVIIIETMKCRSFIFSVFIIW